MQTDNEIAEELRRASAGLMVMSESDYPFEVVQWEAGTEVGPKFLREISGKAADCPVEEVDLDQVLGRFERLELLLRNKLTDVKAYKVGTISIPVYIVGKGPQGSWLGLSTRLIQT